MDVLETVAVKEEEGRLKEGVGDESEEDPSCVGITEGTAMVLVVDAHIAEIAKEVEVVVGSEEHIGYHEQRDSHQNYK